jgi:DNA-binding beta-propeller fold protein YncE
MDGATNGVATTIAVGAGPVAFAWNTAQNRMYVANEEGSSISVLRDSGGGVEETPNANVRRKNAATIVRGVLFVPQSPVAGRQSPCVLLDITGRKVLALKPGANDVSRLRPGVYFVRQASGVGRKASGVTKVVVTR